MPRQNRLPHLSGYIRYAASWRQRGWNLDLPPRMLKLGAIVGLVVAGLAGFGTWLSRSGSVGLAAAVGGVALVLTLAVFALSAFRISLRHDDKQLEPEVRLRREAFQIVERLEQLLDSHRLERDLSLEVTSLLEESARNWDRVRSALESPLWRRAELPAQFRAVREQSLLAVDQGMQELLVLFATSIPEEPGQWKFAEVVDEVVGRDFLTKRGGFGHISPFYVEGRRVADKLLELADQVDDMSRRLAGEALVLGAPRPGAALEATLAELRQIKQAEDELRQDLRN